MTLEEINIIYDISVRTYNLCLSNDLISKERIVDYYVKNKNFLGVRGCGKKSNEELIELCEIFIKEGIDDSADVQKDILNVLSIESELKINLFILECNKLLSKRSYNGISSYLNEDFSYQNFIREIINNHRFELSSIKNIGAKSILELESYIFKIKNYIYEIEKINDNTEDNIFVENNLNDRLLRKIVTNFIELKAKNLSENSKNLVFKYLDNKLNARNFINKILFNNDLEHLDNIEIKKYILSVKNIIYSLATTNDIIKKNKIFIQNIFNISENIIESIVPFYLFNIIDFLLNENKLIKENYKSIFLSTFKIYKSSVPKTLDEIAYENNITRERIRQIRSDLVEEIYEILYFINGLEENMENNYNIITSSNSIEINEDIADKVNELNKTHFSKEFILLVFSVYLKDTHTLIGKYEDVLLHKNLNRRERYNWKNFYLISKEVEGLDFEKLVNDVWERVNERIEETYSFNFKSYISRFIKRDIDIQVIEKMMPVVEKILKDEFNLYLDINENLTFERNTYKQIYEYAYEALEELGKPSSVTEITEKIKELYPNYEISEVSVRTSMRRQYGFIPIGRQSIFGLKKWEDGEGFKGGTIREMVINFLKDSDKPKHISEISEYIIQFKPTTSEKSIMQNLKSADNQKIIFFKDNYIGLKGVEFQQDYEIIDEDDVVKKKSWEERYNDLQNFISRYKRLPLSSGVDEEEIKLYRWINVQKYKIKEYQLEEDKTKLFNRLINFQV